LIMLSFAITLIGGGNEVADGAVIGNADTISTDLLMDKSTRGTTVNSTVFNGNALSELYEKLAGAGADFNTVATKARATKSTYTNTSVKTMHAGMDSNEIRIANGGRNIVVKLDGKEWIVVALTTKDTSSSSDVILTLMLKDVAYNSQWGTWTPSSSTNWSMSYPATMYSTSYIRAGLLNGATNFSTSNGTATTSLTSSQMSTLYSSGLGTGSYPFSIYTDNTEQGNITNFLVKPNEVLYQQYENLRAIATTVSNNWYQAQNENSKYDVASDQWHSNGTIAVQSKPNYYDWGDDLIWLPSLSETGQNSRSGVNASGGLWNLDANQRGVTGGYCSWLRSGGTADAQYAYCLDAAGSYYPATVPSTTGATGVSGVLGGSLAVRPALHLNLSSAALSAATLLTEPSAVDIDYAGVALPFNSFSTSNTPNWYTSSFATLVATTDTTKPRIVVRYYENNNGVKGAQISIPTDAGKYKVEFEIIDTSGKTMWSNYASNSATTRLIDYEINPKAVRFTINQTGSAAPTVTHNTADLAAPDSGSAQGTILGFQYDSLPGAFPEYHGTTLPTVNGTYTATVISLDPNYTPSTASTPNSVQFSVTGLSLTVPTVATASMPYTGNPVRFSLNDFDSSTMEVVTSSLPAGVTFDNVRTLTVTNAGEYTIKVALKDKNGSMYWSSGTRNDTADKEVKFTVTPYKLSVSVDTDNNSGTIKLSANSKVTLTALITGFPLGSDVVNMLFSAEDDPYEYNLSYNMPGSTTAVTTGYPVSQANANLNVELDTGSLSQRTWDFVLKSDNPNYEFDVTPSGIKLDVVAPVVTTDPTWLLMRNGSRIDIQFATLGDATPITYSKSLTFNDRYTYEFKILAPNLTLDTSYGIGGYSIVAGKGNNNSAVGKNADTYITSVRLLDSDNNSTIYTINWTIDPVKFDLSGVKWLYNGQLPYDKINGSKAELDPKTLPAGLVPTVINNTGTTVGMSASASVSFTLDPAYVGNYIQPDETDPSTFIDPNSDFEWSKTWTIVPATIQASSWKNKTNQDANGKSFDIPVLRDPNADGGIVEYEYYECDPMGNIINNTPITINDIVWSESDAKYYIAKPILQDTNNYTLDDPSA
ncbi:MAG: hypothetical protein K2O31_01625, partial [Clostridia bacterium]|nr:hypothetical protein [Clostridia bacterium]